MKPAAVFALGVASRGGRGKWGGGGQTMRCSNSAVYEQLGIIYMQAHFPCTHYHKWQRIFEICDHIQQTHFPFTHYHKLSANG